MKARLWLFPFLLVSQGTVSGQDLLPPRYGWTVEGAGALLDSTAVAGASLLSIAGGPGWWISHATPYGAPGLSYSEAAIAIRRGSAGVAVEWRQLSGDGLQNRSIHVALATLLRRSADPEEVPLTSGAERAPGSSHRPETQIVAGLTFLNLGGSGARSRKWNRYRIGVVRLFLENWSAAAEVRGTIDEPGEHAAGASQWRSRSEVACAVAYGDGPLTLRIGGLKFNRTPLEPSIAISWKDGGVRFSAGGWGSPVVPAAGIDLTIGRITWCLEGRWAAGPGLYLLWSIRDSGGGEQ